MSTAHRPTWEPARGRGDTSHQSKMTSTRSLPSHTKLKFRQQGQEALVSGDDHGEESREALKARLARAEKDARNKKRKAEGLEPEPDSEAEGEENEDEENEDEEGAFKKPRLPERIGGEAKADDQEEGEDTDEDDDGDDDDEDDAEIEARARAILKEQGFDGDNDDDEEDDDEDDDDDDDEDETAQLMRELEKIKAEKAAAAAKKAEEEERERERREEEIVMGNPLLNDGADPSGGGRGRSPSAMSTSTNATGQPSFGVKRRWDDDVIFKNQAAGSKQDKSDFINDMTRSDFHKEFMRRYIK